MDKGQSQTKANEGMHSLVLGRSFAVLVAIGTILLSMLAFNLLKQKKKKKSAEKESSKGASPPSFISPIGEGSDQYDVFLSFRGSDTRNAFADHLYHNLVNEGAVPIGVFRDENSLPIGEEFGTQILDTITRSKISIPIISENYASSKWCLRELIRMMDCKKSTSHIVLPIFYKVAPSDVRHLKGTFGKAFHLGKNRFNEKDIEEGQRALKEVSDLNGWESEKFANGHEGALVKEVIKTILSKLGSDFQLHVTKRLVGIDDHVNQIKNWIDTPAHDARIIGIYGMGGIGKTTLAKIVYNNLSNDFKHRSFLPDIRERAQRDGIPSLQNQLIKEILPNEHGVCIVDHGISLFRSRFKVNKVLIVLDDIDHKNQLEALAGECNWFMTGSIIIVTTRNKAVLDQSEFEVDYPYELNGLNEVNSLLLFKRHAFRMDHSPTDFEDICREIISTMGGLPLALEVVGSYLFRKTNRDVWKDVVKQLKQRPHRDVQEILKISYDALEFGHKEIFLDIACFFIDKDTKYATFMWEGCDFCPSQGIEELKLRCLIKIGHNGKFRMHDQLRDLGRSIFCQGQLPERCLKLWVEQEASRRQIEFMGFPIDDHDWPQDYHRRSEYTSGQFKILPSSRFLHLCYTALSGDFNGLFSELRWLRWSYAEPDLSFSEINFHLSELVVLELSRNKLTDEWRGWSSIMAAKRLKVINLSYSHDLTCTPDLSALTELEILDLKRCRQLEQVHPSIGKVKSLVSLNLADCYNLKELPIELGELKELKELSAHSCWKLREIPSSVGNLSSLQHLGLGWCTSLTEIPSSIGDLQNLQLLDISYSKIEELPSSIGRLKKLLELNLEFCRRLQGYLPREIGDLSSLKTLRVTGALRPDLPQDYKELRSLLALPSGLTYLQVSSPLPSLPQLSCLIHLEELTLYECHQLKDIPELPSRLLKLRVGPCLKLMLPKLVGFKYLEELKITSCNSIDRMDLSQLNRLKRLDINRCDDLIEIQIQGELEFLKNICIRFCKSVERLILPKLQCLEQLEASSCENLVEIRGLDKSELLVALCISDCRSIERLPDLRCFATLKELNINGCCNLRGVERLERFLSCRSIHIRNCQSLRKLPNLSKFENLENFIMIDSFVVTEIPGVEESRSLKHIEIEGCEAIETLPDLSRCEKLHSLVVRDCKKLTQLRGLEMLDLRYLDISGCDSLEMQSELPRTYKHCFCKSWRYGNFLDSIILRER